MADILKTITLTSLGSNAGPLFDVYYSLDCISYTQSVDGNDVSLPYIGSSVNVTIPDTTTCIKLVNLSDVCGMNEYVEFIGGGTTTTTSTTTSTTTTTIAPTTTTTIAPTTSTTTTTAAPIVEYWSASYCNNGNQVPVILKATSSLSNGDVVNWATNDPETCASLTDRYYATPFFSLTINRKYTNCFDCQGITTTTTSTSTTTTTTTLGPSYCWKIVNTTGGSLNVEYYNTINEPIIIGVPGGSTDWICVYGGTTPTGDAGITIEACGTICTSSDSCTGCSAPTTTTTSTTSTTTTSTTTTTTLAPVNFSNPTFVCNDTPYGETPTATVTVTGFTGGSGTYQITNTLYLSEAAALAGTFIDATAPVDYFAVENNTWWVAVRDKNNTSNKVAKSVVVSCAEPTTTTTTIAPTTTTTSTTTTTTLAPVNGTTSVTCNDTPYGETPTATVSITALSGGSGVYQVTNTLYLTEAGALGGTYIDAGTPPIDYFAVENNTWWVGIRDKNNTSNKIAKQIVVSCSAGTTTTTTAAPTTTTTTVAPTTTTTTVAPQGFLISNCADGGITYEVLMNASSVVVLNDVFKSNSTPLGGGQCWSVDALSYGPFDYTNILETVIYNSCFDCQATTTTTTTAAPTTTTTTVAPTTTTTTSAGSSASFYIVNNFFAGTITDVTVNGVSITGASFPLAVGDGTVGTTTQVGTNETVRVYFSSVSPSPSNIQLTDTDLNYQCGVVAGTANELFTNVVVGSGQTVDVLCSDGACP